jgi:predicted DNA-binding protein
MRHRISVRLTDELAEWLSATAGKTGVPQGGIIRDQLEKARRAQERPFFRFAGTVAGPANLSKRKGFSRS